MIKRKRVLAGALALAVAGFGVAACGSDDATKLTQKTLTFTEQDTDDFAFVDNPPKTKLGEQGPEKLSNGDQLAFRSNLLDGAKKRVGTLDATCLITGAGDGSFDKASSTATRR